MPISGMGRKRGGGRKLIRIKRFEHGEPLRRAPKKSRRKGKKTTNIWPEMKRKKHRLTNMVSYEIS